MYLIARSRVQPLAWMPYRRPAASREAFRRRGRHSADRGRSRRQLVPQGLGGKRPPFGKGRGAAEAHEVRQRLILLRETDLEVVAGRRFVEVERLDPRRGARRQVVSVVIEDPGRNRRRSAIVGAAGVGLLAIGGHWLISSLVFGMVEKSSPMRRSTRLPIASYCSRSQSLDFGLNCGAVRRCRRTGERAL
jgi:hypothetical protein